MLYPSPFQIDQPGRDRLMRCYEKYMEDDQVTPELYQLAFDLRQEHKKRNPYDSSLLCVCEDILEYADLIEGDDSPSCEPVVWNLYQRHRLVLESSVMLHRRTRHRWTTQNVIALMILLMYVGVMIYIYLSPLDRWLMFLPALIVAPLILFWEQIMRRLGLSPVVNEVGDCEPFEHRSQLDEVRRCTPDFKKRPYPYGSSLKEMEDDAPQGGLWGWMRRGGRMFMWIMAIVLVTRMALMLALISPVFLIGITLSPQKQKKVSLVWPVR